MRRALLLAAMILATASPGAGAGPQEVVWDVTGCRETAAVLGQRAASDSEVIVALAYECSEATVGDKDFQDFAVSEISVLRPDGSSTLLRQVTNNEALHEGLRALGLKTSVLGEVDYTPGEGASSPSITVSFRGRRYSFSGVGGPSGIPPLPTTGGASYTYEGRKGTIQLSYANHNQSATPALVTVDAEKDPQLSRWLGGSSASGAAIVAAGDWTGTARLLAEDG